MTATLLRGRSRLHLARVRRGGLKTNHVAFRPIDVKRGPNGAIDIADWYNPIIQHGEVDSATRVATTLTAASGESP